MLDYVEDRFSGQKGEKIPLPLPFEKFGISIRNNAMKKLDQARLKELLHYDPLSGVFTWNERKRIGSAGRVPKGIAGTDCHGYIRIIIDGVQYSAYRLAWLYIEGYFPENEIDHINRIKHDDRWRNLREVTRSCNMKNRGLLKNNKSGIPGVCWNKKRKAYQVQINSNGERYNIGRFKTLIEAVRARWNAEIENNFPNCNTSSPAYNYLKKIGEV